MNLKSILILSILACTINISLAEDTKASTYIKESIKFKNLMVLDYGSDNTEVYQRISKELHLTTYYVASHKQQALGLNNPTLQHLITENLSNVNVVDSVFSLIIHQAKGTQIKANIDLNELYRLLNPTGFALIGGPSMTADNLKSRLTKSNIKTYTMIKTLGGSWAKIQKVASTLGDEWAYRNGDEGNSFGSETPLGAGKFHLNWYARPTRGLAAASILIADAKQYIVVAKHQKTAGAKTPSIHVRDAFNGKLLWKKEGPKELPIDRGVLLHGPEKPAIDLTAKHNKLYLLGGKLCWVFNGDNGKVESKIIIPTQAKAKEKDIWLYLSVGKSDIMGASGPLFNPKAGWGNHFQRGISKSFYSYDLKGKYQWAINDSIFTNSIVVNKDHIFYINESKKLICLKRTDGSKVYAVDCDLLSTLKNDDQKSIARFKKEKIEVNLNSYYDGKLWLLFSDRGHFRYNGKKLWIFDAKTGAVLKQLPEQMKYKHKKPKSGYATISFSNGVAYLKSQHGSATTGLINTKTLEQTRFPKTKNDTYRFDTLCTPTVATPTHLLGAANRRPFQVNLKSNKRNEMVGIKPTCFSPGYPSYGMIYIQAPSCTCNTPIRSNLSFKPKNIDIKAIKLVVTKGSASPAKQDSDSWKSWRNDHMRTGTLKNQLKLGTPSKKWTLDLEGHLTNLCATNGFAIFGSDLGFVYGVSLVDGKVHWKFKTKGPVECTPWVENGLVYVGDNFSNLYALNSFTGKSAWTIHLSHTTKLVTSNGNLSSLWPCLSGPLIRKGIGYCFFGFMPNSKSIFFTFDPITGKIITEKPFKITAIGPLTIGPKDKTLFVPSEGYYNRLPLMDFNTERMNRGKKHVTKYKKHVIPLNWVRSKHGQKGRICFTTQGSLVSASYKKSTVHDGLKWILYDETHPFVTTDGKTVILSNGRSMTGEDFTKLSLSSQKTQSHYTPYYDRKTKKNYRKDKTRVFWSAWKDVKHTAAIMVNDYIYSGSKNAFYITSTIGKEVFSSKVNERVLDIAYYKNNIILVSEKGNISCFSLK